MSSLIGRRVVVAAIAGATAGGALASCGRSSAANSKDAGSGGRGGTGVGSMAALETTPDSVDPCGWVSADTVAKLLGPLVGSPRRGLDAQNMQPSRKGRACVYTLARVEPGSDGREEVGVEVVTEDAMGKEKGFESGIALARRVMASVGVRDTTRDTTKGGRAPSKGWDYSDWFPTEFRGRLGHIAVSVYMNTHGTPYSKVPPDSVERLAMLVRDRVPDIPFARVGNHGGSSGGRDACSLITRDEAEAVLGHLAVRPYRSSGDSPLADSAGDGCSYFTGKHRVFTIKPEWDEGKALFRIAAGTSQMFASAVGMKGESADTLEGPWDQVGAATDGALIFLKGDQMLSVVYRTANIDLAAALRLASIAIKRLPAS